MNQFFLSGTVRLRFAVMQLWFARNSNVSIRQQLVTQLILGILSQDLAGGERLPSTRELARRFHLHANTVSAAYRQLESEGWLEFRHGSGVYVRQDRPKVPGASAVALDQLISDFFRSTRQLGIAASTVRSRLRHWLELQPPDRFLLIESDIELRAIVLAEMRSVLKLPVEACDGDAQSVSRHVRASIPVSLRRNAASLCELLPAHADLTVLQIRSVPSSLAKWLPAPTEALVAIASRWPEFLKHARTMMVAAGFDADALVFVDARQPGWRRGLGGCSVVVCDTVTASELPNGCRPVVFPLISETSLAELRKREQLLQTSDRL